MNITARVDFYDDHWQKKGHVERAFPSREQAVDWLISLSGNYVGATSDGKFGIVVGPRLA